MPGKKSTVPTFEVKSILQNLEFLLTRLKDLEATWLEIRNKIPPIKLLSYKKSKCDQSDDFYNSAVALFDIIRFLQYGVKDNAGCAQYYWSSEEKFCKISTNDHHAEFLRGHCSKDYVQHQLKNFSKLFKNDPKQRKNSDFREHTKITKETFQLQLDDAGQRLAQCEFALKNLVSERYNHELSQDMVNYHSRGRKDLRLCYVAYQKFQASKFKNNGNNDKGYADGMKLSDKAIGNSEQNYDEVIVHARGKRKIVLDNESDDGSRKQSRSSDDESDDGSRQQSRSSGGEKGHEISPVLGKRTIDSTNDGSRKEVQDGAQMVQNSSSSSPSCSPGGKKTKVSSIDGKDAVTKETSPSPSSSSSLVDKKKEAEPFKVDFGLYNDSDDEDGAEVGATVDVNISDGVSSNLEVVPDDEFVKKCMEMVQETKFDMILSMNNKLSLSISKGIEKLAGDIPMSSIGFAIASKNDNFSAIEVLQAQTTVCSKYQVLQDIIVDQLLHDPTSIPFDSSIEQNKYLSSSLIGYGQECKKIAKITLENMLAYTEKFGVSLNESEMDAMKLKLTKMNKSTARSLNGFVSYIMRDFVKRSLEKGKEFVLGHLDDIASCRLVLKNCKDPRNNMVSILDSISDLEDKIKETGKELLKDVIHRSDNPSNALQTVEQINLQPTKDVNHREDDYEGNNEDLINLCNTVLGALPSPPAVLYNDGLNMEKRKEARKQPTALTEDRQVKFTITSPRTTKRIDCYTREVKDALTSAEFFDDLKAFKAQHGKNFLVYDGNGAISDVDDDEFKMLNYPEADNVKFYFTLFIF